MGQWAVLSRETRRLAAAAHERVVELLHLVGMGPLVRIAVRFVVGVLVGVVVSLGCGFLCGFVRLFLGDLVSSFGCGLLPRPKVADTEAWLS
jgi:hypothetical protein